MRSDSKVIAVHVAVSRYHHAELQSSIGSQGQRFCILHFVFSVSISGFCKVDLTFCLTWNWVMNEQPHIIGGRDGVEGGTWLAISESGRLAFVTNFRELNPNHEGAVSRGELPTSFLQSSKPPHEYLEEIAARAGDYNGFNLIVADVMAGDMAYLTNRPHDEPIEVKKVRI